MYVYVAFVIRHIKLKKKQITYSITNILHNLFFYTQPAVNWNIINYSIKMGNRKETYSRNFLCVL